MFGNSGLQSCFNLWRGINSIDTSPSCGGCSSATSEYKAGRARQWGIVRQRIQPVAIPPIERADEEIGLYILADVLGRVWHSSKGTSLGGPIVIRCAAFCTIVNIAFDWAVPQSIVNCLVAPSSLQLSCYIVTPFPTPYISASSSIISFPPCSWTSKPFELKINSRR